MKAFEDLIGTIGKDDIPLARRHQPHRHHCLYSN